MEMSDWLHSQVERHGRVAYYPFRPLALEGGPWQIRRAHDQEIIAEGLTLGVARARCNALNAKELVDG